MGSPLREVHGKYNVKNLLSEVHCEKYLVRSAICIYAICIYAICIYAICICNICICECNMYIYMQYVSAVYEMHHGKHSKGTTVREMQCERCCMESINWEVQCEKSNVKSSALEEQCGKPSVGNPVWEIQFGKSSGTV